MKNKSLLAKEKLWCFRSCNLRAFSIGIGITPTDMDNVSLVEFLEEWHEWELPASVGGGCKYVPAEKL
jgi:hypothetical protein